MACGASICLESIALWIACKLYSGYTKELTTFRLACGSIFGVSLQASFVRFRMCLKSFLAL